MSEYTVTLRLNDRDQFVNFVETIGPAVERLVITVQANEAPAEAPMRPQPIKRERTVRGSKVNSTILETLSGGQRTIKELKAALEEARLAPGSLSTGLAALQRAGQIEKLGGGLYGLRMAKAAE